MKIAVVGATGVLGRPSVRLLDRRGHEVRSLSRSAERHPIDLTTGSGLSEALRDIEVVVNASNGPPSAKAAAVLVDGTKRLLEASDAHHVCISIVGCDAVPGAYYRAKVAQEAAVRASGRPFTIVRSTQFHDLIGPGLRAVARWHLELRSRALLQPVDVADVAEVVEQAAERAPSNETLTVAGPEILTLSQMRVARGLPVPVPLPPRLGHALRRGALTIDSPDVRGTQTFAQWAKGRPGV